MRPSLLLDFANTRRLDPRIAFTRASTATYFDRFGVLRTAQANEPRFDYDPVTGYCKGLLIEEARTNLALWARDLTNAAWAKTNGTVVLTATGVDGTANSASTLTATAANATFLQAITRSSAQRITGLFIKRRAGSGAVNLTQDGGTTWTPVTVSADWTRVSLAPATLANPSLGLQIVVNGDAVDVDYAQHEEAPFLTSSIPTTSAAVTRSADSASITGSNFSQWFNATEGTFTASFFSAAGNGAQAAFSVTDGTTNNRIAYFVDSSSATGSGSDTSVAIISVGGVTLSSITTEATVLRSTEYLAAFTYKTGSAAAASNAVLGALGSPASIPAVSQLVIGGQLASSNHLNSHIARLAYYPRRLANADLQELTK